MGEMVIVAYRPKPGRPATLESLVREHVPYLRNLGLATDRAALAMRAEDGTIVEVFEWGDGAVQAAHTNPQVQKLWERFGEACDYIPLRDLPETASLFSHYAPLEL